jgi:hypothetical protein
MEIRDLTPANPHAFGAFLGEGADVQTFGQYRVIARLRDPGSGHEAFVAGMRLAVY